MGLFTQKLILTSAMEAELRESVMSFLKIVSPSYREHFPPEYYKQRLLCFLILPYLTGLKILYYFIFMRDYRMCPLDFISVTVQPL